jgi:hypothetical protein
MCGYVASVPAHWPHNHTHFICISSNSEGSKKLPDDGRLLLKHVGASIWNKGVVQSVHIVGHYYYCVVRLKCSNIAEEPAASIIMTHE